MGAKVELMANGMPWQLADMLGVALPATSPITAAGTTQSGATALNGATFVIVGTTPSGSGVILNNAVQQPITCIFNAGANTLQVYPAVGQKINNQAANVSVTCPANKSVWLIPHITQWIANVSS